MNVHGKASRAALIVCAVALAAAALTLLLPFAGASVIRAWFDALPASEQKTVNTALRALGPVVSGLALALSALVHRRRKSQDRWRSGRRISRLGRHSRSSV